MEGKLIEESYLNQDTEMNDPVQTPVTMERPKDNCANCNAIIVYGVDKRYGPKHIMPRLGGLTLLSVLLKVFSEFSDQVSKLQNDTSFIVCGKCMSCLAVAFKNILKYENWLNKSGRLYTSILQRKDSPLEINKQISENASSSRDSHVITDTQSSLSMENESGPTCTLPPIIPTVSKVPQDGITHAEEKANICCSHCGLSLNPVLRNKIHTKLRERLPENTMLCSAVLRIFFPSLSTKIAKAATKNELIICDGCARNLSFAQKYSDVFTDVMDKSLESGTFSNIFKDIPEASATPPLPKESSTVAAVSLNTESTTVCNPNVPATATTVSLKSDVTQGPREINCDHCGLSVRNNCPSITRYVKCYKLPAKMPGSPQHSICTALENLFPDRSEQIALASKINQLIMCTDCVTKLSGAFNSLQRFNTVMNTTHKNGTYATIFGFTDTEKDDEAVELEPKEVSAISRFDNTTRTELQLPKASNSKIADISSPYPIVRNYGRKVTKNSEVKECLVCLKFFYPEEEGFNEKDESAGENQIINTELETEFLFRQLLELPQDICCQFSDHGNPSIFDYCGSCWQKIVNTKRIFDTFVRLQKKYEKFQMKMMETVTQSVKLAKISGHPNNLQVLKRYFGSEEESLSGNEEQTKECYEHDGFDNYVEEVVNTSSQEEMEKCVATNEAPTVEKKSMYGQNTQCQICKKNFKSPRNLRHHQRNPRVHSKVKDCNLCGKTFKSQCLLRIHCEMKHSDLRKYKCSICEKLFKTMANLRAHKKVMHTVRDRKYLCDTCGKSYKSISTLKGHEKSHLEKKYRCRYCDKGFLHPNRLKLHEAIHTGVRNHFCSICGKGFIRKKILDGHMQVHDEEKKFSCHICGKCFQTERVLSCHLRETHSNRQYPCKICNKVFKSRRYVLNHEAVVHSGDSYQCHLCDDSFRIYRNFLMHLKQHKNESDNPSVFKCHNCDETFDSVSNLRGHRKLSGCMERDRRNRRKFLCTICGKTFLYEGSLLRHNKIHEGNKQETRKMFQCRGCEETFEYFWGLWLHKQQCTEKVKKPITKRKNIYRRKTNSEFPCTICGIVFDQIRRLRRHKLLSHSEVLEGYTRGTCQLEKKYKCESCGRSFLRPFDLRIHKLRIHSMGTEKLRTFTCEYCGNVYRNKHWFRDHMNIHTGERYSCKICDQTFVWNSDLKRHLRDIHKKGYGMYQPGAEIEKLKRNECDICGALVVNLKDHKKRTHGEKKIECERCGKKFYCQHSLQKHLSSHIGPYTCNICGVTNATQRGLVIHKRIHSEETPFQCSQCGKCYRLLKYLTKHTREYHADES